MHGYHGISAMPVLIIIGIIWFIWFLNSVFNMIIMLNFMISIVGASFSNVMNRKNQLMFTYKSDLNQEVAIFRDVFGTNNDIDIITILTLKNPKSGTNIDEMKGMFVAIKDELEKVQDAQKLMVDANTR